MKNIELPYIYTEVDTCHKIENEGKSKSSTLHEKVNKIEYETRHTMFVD